MCAVTRMAAVARKGAVRIVIVGILLGGSGPLIIGAMTTYKDESQQEVAELRGRVVDSATGNGVSGARVVVSARGNRSQVILTESSGEFLVRDVPAGSHQITVTHPSYGGGGYGQMWPGGPLRAFRFNARSPHRQPVIRLWSRAAISGALRAPEGLPIVGATVHLIPAAVSLATTIAAKPFTAVSGKDAVYRFDVPPGKYVLGTVQSYQTTCTAVVSISTCALRGRDRTLAPVREADDTKVYRTTFYRDVPQLSEAETIWVHPGESLTGMDMTVPLTGGVRVSGTVQSTDGPLPDILVRAKQLGNVGISQAISIADATALTDKEGRFMFRLLPSGHYSLYAEHRAIVRQLPIIVAGPFGPVESGSVVAKPLSDADPLFEASAQLTVGTEDIAQVDLFLRPAPFLRGVVQFDGDRPRPDIQTLTSRSVIVRSAAQDFQYARARLDDDGHFYFPSLRADTYSLSIDPLPGWSIHSVTTFGRNSSDRTADVRYQSIGNVVIYLTDRAGSIGGLVVNATGQAEPNASVFVFPSSTASPGKTVNSEQMRAVNVSELGLFESGPVEPGSYFVVAVSDASFDLDWRQPEIRQRLSRYATGVRVQDHEVTNVTLQGLAIR